MHNLPVKARIYLISVCLIGVLVSVVTWFWNPVPAQAKTWELVAFLALALLCGWKKIPLMRNKGEEEVGSMSLGFALTFAAMLRFGPAISLVIGFGSCLSGCLYPKRQPFYQLAFNVGLGLLEVWLANMAYLI